MNKQQRREALVSIFKERAARARQSMTECHYSGHHESARAWLRDAEVLDNLAAGTIMVGLFDLALQDDPCVSSAETK